MERKGYRTLLKVNMLPFFSVEVRWYSRVSMWREIYRSPGALVLGGKYVDIHILWGR